MNVLLASAWGGGRAFDELAKSADLGRFGNTRRVTDPATADVILFVENVHFEDLEWRRVLQHPYVERFREKCFLYNESDRPWCVLPGLYCSMPRRAFDPKRQRAFAYLYEVNASLTGPAGAGERPHLYSFMGAANCDVRRRLLKLTDARAVLEDTSAFNLWHSPVTAEERARRFEHYAKVMAGSLFVLCPRGAGTSSYRLFETLKAGRAPVLLSDQWVAPKGPDWDSFMLRVPEARVADLPRLLRAHEAEALARGALARRAYDEWFAPEVLFHRAAEACGELLAARQIPESVARLKPSLEHQRARVHRWLHEGKNLVRRRIESVKHGR